MCFGGTIIDIGTQGMQRHTALAIPFGTRNFSTVSATSTHDFDALCTQAHCVLHRALHSTTEHHTTLELLSNRVSNQLCIGFRLADLFDVYMNRYAHELLQLDLEFFDVLTAFADHYPRACRVNGDAGIFGRTLDDYTANRGVL